MGKIEPKYALIFWKERPIRWTALSIKLVSNPFMLYNDQLVDNIKFPVGKTEPPTGWSSYPGVVLKLFARKSEASAEAESLIEKYRLANPDYVAATDYEDDNEKKLGKRRTKIDDEDDDKKRLEKHRTKVDDEEKKVEKRRAKGPSDDQVSHPGVENRSESKDSSDEEISRRRVQNRSESKGKSLRRGTRANIDKDFSIPDAQCSKAKEGSFTHSSKSFHPGEPYTTHKTDDSSDEEISRRKVENRSEAKGKGLSRDCQAKKNKYSISSFVPNQSMLKNGSSIHASKSAHPDGPYTTHEDDVRISEVEISLITTVSCDYIFSPFLIELVL